MLKPKANKVFNGYKVEKRTPTPKGTGGWNSQVRVFDDRTRCLEDYGKFLDEFYLRLGDRYVAQASNKRYTNGQVYTVVEGMGTLGMERGIIDDTGKFQWASGTKFVKEVS